MFELSFIKKYLTPQKKQLSISLIAVLSVVVITLVVWLVVVFLSVTEGIERTWLHKLTALNAPIRIQPTKEYFSSYYYNVDKYSAASHYMSKTIGQKARALLSDPYNPQIDEELPLKIPRAELSLSGTAKDLVKDTIGLLQDLKQDFPDLTFQDVELSGALLRLELLRQEATLWNPAEMHSQLTNVSYLASFTEKNPLLSELILPPSVEDLNHLLFLANRSKETDPEKLDLLLSYSHIEKVKTKLDLWHFPAELLPEKVPFFASGYIHEGSISHIMIPDCPSKILTSTIEKRGNRLFYKTEKEPEQPLALDTPLFSQGALEFIVKERAKDLFSLEGKLQNKKIEGKTSLEGLLVTQAHFARELDTSPPIWPYYEKGKNQFTLPQNETKTGILLAKSFRDNGVKMGDEGYLAYSAATISGKQEIHVSVYVAGFYDPGIMAIGNKCILVPQKITQAINASESAFTLDRGEANSILVWFPHLQDAPKIKTALLQKFQREGLDKYWQVKTFREYDFAKDLMQQFESDKYLFTLVGGLILLVGCTNIISLLILLVSDKKKEIGILRAMGAKRRSIAAIFALSGATLGLFSCLLGIFLAFITLKNIDFVVHILSLFQGHEVFNAQFFGQSLPHEISPRAFLFAAIVTPLLALIAGLLPAIKAACLNPCEALRSE